MSKPIWACPMCGEDFTRKSSAVRHSSRLHEGTISPVRFINYLTGRLSGEYPPPITPPRLMGRKNKTVADSSKGDISYANEFHNNNWSGDFAAPLMPTGPFKNPIAEAVRNFIEVKKTYTLLSPLINFNAFPTDIGVAKPIGFKGICDVCQSGQIEAVWKFVENGSLTKVIHTCDTEAVMRVRHQAEEQRNAFRHESIRCLAYFVKYWIGHIEVYLKAEELLPTESLDFVTGAGRRSSHVGCISLGDLKKNHWADRAIKQKSTGAAIINENELMDFLSNARATFGIFQVKMPEGRTRDFFIYIVRASEFCKFNHINGLAARSSHIINSLTPQQIDLYKVIQFVDGGSIFRWDLLDSTSKKNLLGQIHEWSKNQLNDST